MSRAKLKTIAFASIIYGFLIASIEVDKKTFKDTGNVIETDKDDITTETILSIKEQLAKDIKEYLDSLQLDRDSANSLRKYISILKSYLNILQDKEAISLEYIIFSIPLLLRQYDLKSYNILQDVIDVERAEIIIDNLSLQFGNKIKQREIARELINYYYSKVGRSKI